MLNNGTGGTSVTTRVFMSSYPVYVLNYGTASGNATQGSALYDSAAVGLVAAKSFAALYDNTSFTGRPLTMAVVEDDGMDLYAVTSVVNFYQTTVDTIPQRWGTIIPNANANGVKGLQYFDLFNAQPIALAQYTDADGTWCSGVVTTDPSNGATAAYLNSTLTCGTGVANETAELAFAVMPNPSEGSLTVKCASAETQVLFVRNTLGEVVLTRTFSGTISLDLSALPKGAYAITLKNSEGQCSTRKVILR